MDQEGLRDSIQMGSRTGNLEIARRIGGGIASIIEDYIGCRRELSLLYNAVW